MTVHYLIFNINIQFLITVYHAYVCAYACVCSFLYLGVCFVPFIRVPLCVSVCVYYMRNKIINKSCVFQSREGRDLPSLCIFSCVSSNNFKPKCSLCYVCQVCTVYFFKLKIEACSYSLASFINASKLQNLHKSSLHMHQVP